MIELVILAFIGAALGGLWDLKTTEVPDEIPALMISLGLFILFLKAIFLGEVMELFASLVIGTALLAFGIALYKKGQWGGADAWMLAAIGYLIPFYGGRLFMIDYLPNFLIVSAGYMFVYTLGLGLLDPTLFKKFPNEFKVQKKLVIGILLAFLVPIGLLSFTLRFSLVPLVSTFVLVVLLAFFLVYAKVIEKYAFKKRISVSKLRVGDVLEEMLWRGITAEELVAAKKKYKFVTIKEGVRFVPVFAITIIVTILFGNLLFGLF
jgi:Flp pilus assembly protein protease CpaA